MKGNGIRMNSMDWESYKTKSMSLYLETITTMT